MQWFKSINQISCSFLTKPYNTHYTIRYTNILYYVCFFLNIIWAIVFKVWHIQSINLNSLFHKESNLVSGLCFSCFLESWRIILRGIAVTIDTPHSGPNVSRILDQHILKQFCHTCTHYHTYYHDHHTPHHQCLKSGIYIYKYLT